MTEREELTADERSLLESLYIPGADAPGHKALRIIDAHAADRAALVARVRELEEAVRALVGAPEPPDYDPITAPVAPGDWNGPHGALQQPAALRAAPDYQAALDQEHRLACEWQARYEAECVEHTVTRDRLHAAVVTLEEAASLQARADSWQRGHDYAWERLTAANALLRECIGDKAMPGDRIRAFLAGDE